LRAAPGEQEQPLEAPKYIVGIDLGTTHCVVAYTEVAQDPEEPRPIRIFPIPQVISPGEVKARPLLPSFLLLPGPHDVPAGSLALPWNPDLDYAVGEFARNRGAEIPNRLVASVKSWLCHNGVDRSRDILPWDSPPGVVRISPVAATSRYLEHIGNAWNHLIGGSDPAARLEGQEIFLTVPASFDAVARELTVTAAREAGFEHLTLLEEPQAAFYAWLESRVDDWRRGISVGDSILVCDIGGGTTDFSLIQVTDEDGELGLRRVAVGDHILLGGDNMDLALAYAVQAKLARQRIKLDDWQFRGLWHGCRQAKERLLAEPDREVEPVVVLGRGSALIGGTIRTELTRSDVTSVLLEGFLPVCGASDFPVRQAKVGMREMGLPYASDPAVTRHLARFLGRQVEAVGDPSGGVAYPSAVLFNGGVMKSAQLRDRITTVLNQWRPDHALRELHGVDPDLAVARGAAYYGLARRGRGIRIRAGASRSYYIGIATSMPAVPGIPAPLKALCVVPFGMEEGSEVQVREREFALVVGESAVFPLLASTVRQADQAGEVVDDWSGDIEEVNRMETNLPASEQLAGGHGVPVWLQSRYTEVGTLELYCVARDGDERWKLEFDLRQGESPS